MNYQKLYDKVAIALYKDITIASTVEEIRSPTFSGFSLKHAETLGLTKRDLKTLAAAGLAVIGYQDRMLSETSKGKTKLFRWALIRREEPSVCQENIVETRVDEANTTSGTVSENKDFTLTESHFPELPKDSRGI